MSGISNAPNAPNEPKDSLPLVIGAIVQRNLRELDFKALESQVRAIFKQIKEDYQDPPLIVLSTLAEGADWLVAHVALAEGARLVAVLLMRPEEYKPTSSPRAPKEDLSEYQYLSSEWAQDLQSNWDWCAAGSWILCIYEILRHSLCPSWPDRPMTVVVVAILTGVVLVLLKIRDLNERTDEEADTETEELTGQEIQGDRGKLLRKGLFILPCLIILGLTIYELYRNATNKTPNLVTLIPGGLVIISGAFYCCFRCSGCDCRAGRNTAGRARNTVVSHESALGDSARIAKWSHVAISDMEGTL
jgi:hypothetical protein